MTEDLIKMDKPRSPGQRPIEPEAEGKWTFDSLCEYVTTMIAANDKRYEQRAVDFQRGIDAAFAAQKAAIDAAFAAQKSAVEAAFVAQKSAVDAAMGAADKAVTKAEMAAEKRFENMNEFRGQLRDQQMLFVSRAEVDIRFSSVDEKITSVYSKIDSIDKAIHMQLKTVSDSQITSTGRAQGMNILWGIIIAVISIALMIWATIAKGK